MRRRAAMGLLALAACVAGCGGQASGGGAAGGPPARLDYTVVATHPHDPQAFTEGLAVEGDQLWESTGAYTQYSTLRQVSLDTGSVERRVDVAHTYFAEGVTLLGSRVFQLTWQTHIGFVYDRATLRQTGQFSYATEGWGLTQDGNSLIMSDGTDTLRFLDPSTFAVQRSLRVTRPDGPVSKLNELEYVRGAILANVFNSSTILRIDPASGHVTGTLDLGRLDPHVGNPEAVLNGIAFDPAADRLLVTGKLWPQLFEIRITNW